MDQEKFYTLKPKSPFLRQYISYYYFHYSLDNDVKKRYVYYPHTKSALTIYKSSKTLFSPNHSKTIPDPDSNYSFLYSGVQKQLRMAEIIAPFDKIGIVFNVLGINHFIESTLSKISNHPIDKSFNYFGNKLIEVCDRVYAEKEIDKKIDLLDRFFEESFCDFKYESLKNCIDIIQASNEKLTVSELASISKINTKTLLRLFKNHIGVTPKNYLDIVQFRKSLNAFILENKSESFSHLVYDNQYYDQSQFINHFKKLSGANPKLFFKEIKHVGSEDIFWTLK